MERVLDGLILIKVHCLDTSIFIADVESSIDGVKGNGQSGRG